MLPNRQSTQLPTRSSRRQRGLSPFNPWGSQNPIMQTPTNLHTNSTTPSTEHENLHGSFQNQQNIPSIVNTINTNSNLSYISSVHERTPQPNNPNNNNETLSPIIIPNSNQHTSSHSSQSIQSIHSQFHSHDSFPREINFNPQDVQSSSTQLHSVIHQLQSMINTLQTTTNELRNDLRITREENLALRNQISNLQQPLPTQHHNHSTIPPTIPQPNHTSSNTSISNLISLDDPIPPNSTPNSINNTPTTNTIPSTHSSPLIHQLYLPHMFLQSILPINHQFLPITITTPS